MNRDDFAKNKKAKKGTFRHDVLNSGNIRIYLNDVVAPRIQLMRLEASMSNGFIRAHVRQLQVLPGTNQVDVMTVNGELQPAYKDINPKLEGSLILERVDSDGKWNNFYLRTIITQ